MMHQLIERFPSQLEEGIEIGKKIILRPHSHEFRNIFIVGLGGSGIGANFTDHFLSKELKIPLIIGKEYEIPAFVNKYTLAIVSSYSGNTEETIAAFRSLQKTKAKIIVISSGGKLIESAQKFNLDYILIPAGWSSPRACLGYSIVAQLSALFTLDLCTNESLHSIAIAAKLLRKNKSDIKAKAKEISTKLNGKIPIIYGTDLLVPVLMRFRQQVNENSKKLAWHNVFPELNHNELVGWREKNKNLAVICFRTELDLYRNKMRMDISREIIQKYTDVYLELYPEGVNLVEQSLYFVHLVDWISYYLSELHGVDSVEIEVIEFLKSELEKLE